MKSKNANYEYLAAIYILLEHSDNVRSIDIVRLRKVSKAAVSKRMKQLRESGYISMDSEGISLTKKGREIAEKIHKSHKSFQVFLERIGVDTVNADEIASYVAHIITPQSLETCSLYIQGME